MNDSYLLEKRSSSITLSDMELFVFPDLIYSLVLANIASPRIWNWRADPWFEGIEKMKPSRRIARLKQYIMDHYAFNLDLDTWGLTTKTRELERFKPFIDPAAIREANALFGYEGDKYYFDIDIRAHFGLDKYDGDVIPYWKTETVEAMDAFQFKENYGAGAGECVSLATLYAAALFVVARIPLQQIYLMATPLHSQNFIDVDDGILTNNRRLVTRKMWCNGTALSAQARRALENECVTLVAHEGGFIHTIYEEATIEPAAYERFTSRLRTFLKTELTSEILGNFLRHSREIQKCFQLRWPIRSSDRYLPAERAFAYEDGSPYMVTDRTRDRLLAEIDMEEFEPARIPGRIVFNDLETFVTDHRIDLHLEADVRQLKDRFSCDCLNADLAIENLIRFCYVEPRLPDARGKRFTSAGTPLGITPDMGREQIVERLESIRGENPMADMAFYAYRDLSRTDARPFVKAAVERNPVSIDGAKELADDAAVALVSGFPADSIYDGPGRLAQPDEVWNYRRGDGVEKALLLANILGPRHPGISLSIDVAPERARLHAGAAAYEFPSRKGLPAADWNIRT